MNTLNSILDSLIIRKPASPSQTGQQTGVKEGFATESQIIGFTTLGIVIILFIVILCIAFAIGAGKLSYCYSRSVGYSNGASLFWAFLSFIFCNLYYPYYALFLDKTCSSRSNAAAPLNLGGAAVGGARGGSRRR